MLSRVSLAKLTLALALGLAVVAGGWRAVAAFQFNPQPDLPGVWHSGPVALPPGDYAQVNVAFVADPADFRHPPDPGRVQIQFFDGTGRLLAETMEEVPAGQARSFRYNMGRIIGGGDTNPPPDDGSPPPDDGIPPPDDELSGIVRARVLVLNRTPGGMSAVMELGDQEAQSSRFSMPGDWLRFNPQPEPPAVGRRFR